MSLDPKVIRSTVDVIESAHSSYGPRTRHNAHEAHVTAAFAVDFTTRGEALTHSAAGDRHLALPLAAPPIESARKLFVKLRAAPGRTLNVAGNGLTSSPP